MNQMLLVVVSLYAILIIAGLCSYWLSQPEHSVRLLRWAPVLAALATGVIWEGFCGILRMNLAGSYGSPVHSYGFVSGWAVLLPLLRVAGTSVMAFPSAWMVAVLYKRVGNA